MPNKPGTTQVSVARKVQYFHGVRCFGKTLLVPTKMFTNSAENVVESLLQYSLTEKIISLNISGIYFPLKNTTK